MNIDGDALQLLIGLGGGPVAVISLTNHVKRATEWLTQIIGWEQERTPDAAPWPLVSDLLGVAFAFALNDSGLLAPIAGPEPLRWPVVVLVGLVVFGLGSSAIVDQKRAIVARAQANPPGAV